MNKGDLVICSGVGYPHWKDHVFIVEVNFLDGTIGLNNKIRVSKSDFQPHICGGQGEFDFITEQVQEKGFYYHQNFI